MRNPAAGAYILHKGEKTYLRRIVTFCCLALVLAGAPPTFAPTPEVDRALASISPDALRGHLSFLASDLLEGRGTPSRGLDIAAEYIAAQFRCAALEPAGDDGYFQTESMVRAERPGEGFEMRLQKGEHVWAVAQDQVAVVSRQAVDISGVPVYKARRVADLPAHGLTGDVLALEAGSHAEVRAIAKAAAALRPAAFLIVDETGNEMHAPAADVEQEQATFGGTARLVVRAAAAVKVLHAAKSGETTLTVSIKMPTPVWNPIKVRNVLGLLRGSDPALRGQYVLLTAHYDHLGMESPERIFHGANDDGSGTVSVIEIGRALAALRDHRKRSILFMTFFGEEEGGLGSRYYADHPVFPLKATVADLNLEQLGRTDATEGREVSNASLTGFDYTNVPRTLQEAGRLTGVNVYKAPHGDQYFGLSDNLAFAEHGIPAHTIVVAFGFPDYHAVGDIWQKIDYGNLAKVDRMIALGTIMLADAPEPPQWNRSNPKVARFLRVN